MRKPEFPLSLQSNARGILPSLPPSLTHASVPALFSFDFCEMGEDPETGKTEPKEGATVSENLGQILLGERIRHSPYQIRMREDV